VKEDNDPTILWKRESVKLIHGDCLEEMKAIPYQSVDMILADPPYGTTACEWDSVIPLEPMWNQLIRIVKPTGAIVLTASQPFTTSLIHSNMNMFKYCWVWNKIKPSTGLHANQMPLKCTEDVIVFGKSIPYYAQMIKKELRIEIKNDSNGEAFGNNRVNKIHNNCEKGYPKNIIEISNADQSDRHHPTQKPVSLMEYLIKTYTNENETVLDFTMGSGTTGVACRNTNRKFIGIELDETYFNTARNRIGV